MKINFKIESYLFALGSSISVAGLAKIVNASLAETRTAVEQLVAEYQDRGIVIVYDGNEVTMGTHPDTYSFLSDLRKQELSGPLSRGALETLVIILYHPDITKPDIDYLRGVNSQFMLRNLLVRGLIQKINNTDDKRIPKYTVTIDTLKLLGITDVHDLPEYDMFMTRMQGVLDENSSVSE